MTIELVVGILAILGGVVAVFRGIIRPAFRLAADADRLVPVMRSIADDFKSDGGNTLRDKIDRMDRDVKGLRKQVRELDTKFEEFVRMSNA